MSNKIIKEIQKNKEERNSKDNLKINNDEKNKITEKINEINEKINEINEKINEITEKINKCNEDIKVLSP